MTHRTHLHIGILVGRMRVEEKLLVQEIERRGLTYELIYDNELILDTTQADAWRRFDVILERCVSHSRALTALAFFEMIGVPTVNTYAVAEICGDKIRTSLAPCQRPLHRRSHFGTQEYVGRGSAFNFLHSGVHRKARARDYQHRPRRVCRELSSDA